MSAEQIPAGGTVHYLDRHRPTIVLGREQPAAAVERLPDAAPREPAWLRAGRAAATISRTTGLGAGTALRRAWHYQAAGDLTGQIRKAEILRDLAATVEERKALDAELVRLRAERQIVRAARRREHRATAAGTAAGVVAVAVLAALAGLIVLPAAAASLGGAAWIAGRRELAHRREAAALTAGPGDDEPDGPLALEPAPGRPGVYTPDMLPNGKPFPIGHAHTDVEAAECILRALIKEGIPVGDISGVERTVWGWQCEVRVTEGTPAAIITRSDDLETLFDTAQGSVRVQPSVERRARAKLRIILSDPFASAPPPEYRAPGSMSITDRGRIGSSIDGDPLLVTLAGVMGEAIAASGGGKTGILQALAEITTACRDAITIDLDPAGDGLEDLGPAARLQGRTHEQIEHTLLFLLMLAKARARLRKHLGMGRKWAASREHPAIVAFIDEYPKLSKLAKRLAFELLLVGRKEAITVILASQGGTTVYLGENIAQMLALKIVGPCKVVDTRAVFGDGAAAEGWLPHRLSPATATDSRDAGHVYAQGVPGMQDAPVEYKIHEHPKGMLARLADERRDAGLLDPDADSLTAMADVDLPDYVEPEYDNEGNIRRPAPVELLTWEQLLRLCEADPPAAEVTPVTRERQAVRAALDTLKTQGLDRFRVETMAEALATRYPDLFDGLTADELGRLLRDAGCGTTVSIGAVDGLANARGYRRDALEAAL
ncbi:hypothetical protein RM780_03915 [Streptomyces sp. DSM 44917]|uniref:FtsK domain-containing protein n=1 Tax=Streptomyces boetiae TaxID=3075541 RepID=A0ABU2L3H5_9ACTN|nr:hypothetical protein [Streptomyces sp. DSM 44917]MDT0306109.1 hypothetical protein [Streptomyces sp. DSM 44917]